MNVKKEIEIYQKEFDILSGVAVFQIEQATVTSRRLCKVSQKLYELKKKAKV